MNGYLLFFENGDFRFQQEIPQEELIGEQLVRFQLKIQGENKYSDTEFYTEKG